jgi:hypothetical protein
MITIEIHGTEFGNERRGTHVGTVGRKAGVIRDVDQAERRLIDMTYAGEEFARAYFLKDGEPIAAWLRNGNGEFRCVGHSSDYTGLWGAEMPYAHPDAMRIASVHLGRNALTGTQEQWATEQLIGATATAILLDERGIVAAWEPAQPGFTIPTLAATGPIRTP